MAFFERMADKHPVVLCFCFLCLCGVVSDIANALRGKR